MVPQWVEVYQVGIAWYSTQMNSPASPLSGVSVPPATLTTPSGIKIHNIQTGYVAVKTAHREFNGADGLGFPTLMLDPNWTEWLPIHTWVIEHPEGVIVIDTGESAAASDLNSNYFECNRGDNFIYRSILRLAVSPEDEIASQLRTLNIPTNEVRWIVQTHLHSDHMDGLVHFPNSNVLVSPVDYPESIGVVTCNFPDNFDPTLVQFIDEAIVDFPNSYRLTRAGDVIIVPTPGHSNGHQSVILVDGDIHYFFAGDTSFDVPQLLDDKIAGIVSDPSQSRSTLAQIRSYTQTYNTVYLPSHDADSRNRLLNGITVQN